MYFPGTMIICRTCMQPKYFDTANQYFKFSVGSLHVSSHSCFYPCHTELHSKARTTTTKKDLVLNLCFLLLASWPAAASVYCSTSPWSTGVATKLSQQDLGHPNIAVTHNLMSAPCGQLLTKEILGGTCTVCRNHIREKKRSLQGASENLTDCLSKGVLLASL